MSIKTLEDVRNLLKFLGNGFSLSDKVKNECLEADRFLSGAPVTPTTKTVHYPWKYSIAEIQCTFAELPGFLNGLISGAGPEADVVSVRAVKVTYSGSKYHIIYKHK